MASILKNQILKHLSKFTKNLSQDKINLSTFKGEGELTNLELDEVILMELLDLPTWMRLKRATCSKVQIKIQWTKLKSQPIYLFLDEVVLEVETCEEPRPPNNPAHMASYRSGGKYGFVDRVIDGIFVHINSVSVKFMSKKFHASLQLSRVQVRSMTPNWQKAEQLQQTRIRDANRGEVLLFKEVDWQTTRIEATAVEEEKDEHFVGTPLRFIANQSKIRITMKKRLSDCSIISTRVMLLLDDLLWVLTTTQLKAAILYANSLKEMMKKSREQSKKEAAEKLQRQCQTDVYLQQQQQSQRQRSNSNSVLARLFAKYDVLTTSYHIISSRIDLHLCDDSTPQTSSGAHHDKRIEGGAMQIVFYRLSVDIYPYNQAGGERKSWYRYTDNQGSRNHWVQQLFSAFKTDVTKARETCCVASPSQSPAHHPANQRTPEKAHPSNQNQAKSSGSAQQPIRPQSGSQPARQRTTKLLESCTVLKVEEFTIYRISTADNLRNTPQKFLSSDKKQLHLPSDMSVIHAEYTEYYFPEGIDYPVPHANLYILVNPIRLTVDYLTLLWINYFGLSLSDSVNIQTDSTTSPVEHVDIKLEAVMPRVIVPSETKVEGQPERPEGLQIQISRLTATNSRVEDQMMKDDLKYLLEKYNKAHLFTSVEFPNDRNDLISIPKHFHNHAYGLDNPYIEKYAKGLIAGQLPNDYQLLDEGNLNVGKLLKTNTLKQNAGFDVWSLMADQVWLEFVGVPSSKSRPVPFVEAFPLAAWICYPPVIDQASSQGNTESQSSLCNGDIICNRSESDSSGSERDSPERECRAARKLLKHYHEKADNSEHGDRQSSQKDETSGQTSTKIDSGAENICDNSVHETIKEQRSQEAICDTTSGAKLSSVSGDVSRDNVQYSVSQVANVHVIAKVDSKIKAQMNHFQYLFILRMIESFTNFQLHMNSDVEQILGKSGPGLKFSIPLIVPELEFSMVCSYVAELLQYGDHMPLSPSGGFKTFDDLVSVQIQESDSTQDLGQDDQFIEDINPENYDNLALDTAPTSHGSMSKSLSDSRIQCHSSSTMPNSHSAHETNGLDLTREANVFTSDTLHPQHSHSLSMNNVDTGDVSVIINSGETRVSYSSGGSDSGYSADSRNKTIQIKKSTNKTADQVKKSFTSALSGFTDKIKAKMDIGEDNLSVSDDLDSMSIRTDTSDDDDDFEMLSLEDGEFPAFQHDGPSETASSGTDGDDLSSIYADSSTATKGRELISVILFNICDGEVLLQNNGVDTTVRIQAKQLLTQQPGNMYYEEFCNKFSSHGHGFTYDDKIDSTFSRLFPVKLKFISGPGAELDAHKGEELGFLDVNAKSCNLEFTMSSLTSMAAFIEDEKLADTLPMHISVTDLNLTLKEDRPPPIGSTFTPEPVKLFIHKININRGEDGIFHISGDTLPMNVHDNMAASVETIKVDSGEGENKENELSLPLKGHEPMNHPAVHSIMKENEELKKSLSNSKKFYENIVQELTTRLEDMSKIDDERQLLRKQLKQFTAVDDRELDKITDLRKVNETLESENLQLQHRVSCLEEELKSSSEEKDSLLLTLKLLQDELQISEQRHRTHSKDS